MSLAETGSEPPTTSSTAEETDAADELTRDDIFHVLQCRRRRLVLKYLHEYEGDEPARMSDIAEHIAALEHDTTVDALRSKQRQRVYIALYQSHLPKMDDAGVIEYNQDRGMVEATDLACAFESYLDQEPSLLTPTTPESESDPALAPGADIDRETESTSGEPDWHKRYLGVAAGAVVTVAGLGLSGVSLPFTAGAGLAMLVSVVFFALALGHWLATSSPSADDGVLSASRDLIK